MSPPDAAPQASVQLASRSDVGQVRTANEDSCEIFSRDDGARLLVVADGMGGAQGGATASQTALAAIAATFESTASARPAAMLVQAIQDANDRVFELAQAQPELEGMGTTVVAFHLDPRQRGTVAHVGDSRAYRYRRGRLEPLTTDHSVVAEMQRRGLLSAAEAAAHPRRNEILRAVGVAPEVEVEIAEVEVAPGDRFVLCSDGLSGVVEDEEIAAIVQSADPETAVDRLIEMANDRGGPDNITVQILSIPADEAEGDPEATAPVELSSVGIEAIETRRRQRRRGRRIGGALAAVAACLLAYLVWQLASGNAEPDPATERSVPATAPRKSETQPTPEAAPAEESAPAPVDRFDIDRPVPRRGVPRDDGR
jgi:protein phosphatase